MTRNWQIFVMFPLKIIMTLNTVIFRNSHKNICGLTVLLIILCLPQTKCLNSPKSQEDILARYKRHVPVKDSEHKLLTGARAYLYGALFVTPVFAVLWRHIFQLYDIFFPVEPLVFLITFSVRLLERKYYTVPDSHPVISMIVSYFLSLYLPVSIFKLCFNLNQFTLRNSWLQIIFVTIPGFLLNGVLVGSILLLSTVGEWRANQVLILGTTVIPIYSKMVIDHLKCLGSNVRPIINILEGESIFSTIAATIIIGIIIGFDLKLYATPMHVVTFLLRFVGGGLVAGYLMGRLSCVMFRKMRNDPVVTFILTAVFPLMSYYVSSDLLACSGTTALVVLVILLDRERFVMAPEVEMFVDLAWDMFEIFISSFFFGTLGTLFADMLWVFDVQLIIYMFITYLVTYSTRFLIYLLFSPILGHFGAGKLTFRHLIVTVWAGQKSGINIALLLYLYSSPLIDSSNLSLLVCIGGMVLISYAFNIISVPPLLKCLSLENVSLTRAMNMNNCVKHVLDVRESTFYVLKNDRFMRDAEWPFVKNATLPKHPYVEKAWKNEDDDDVSMFTICPDCHRVLLIQPTQKELEDMLKEAKKKILKARKILYCKLYRNGMISLETSRYLTFQVDTAAESKDLVLDVNEIIKALQWKVLMERIRILTKRVFAIKRGRYFRKPKTYWRRRCYYLMRHPAFEPTIMIVLLLNLALLIAHYNIHVTQQDNQKGFDVAYLVMEQILVLFYASEFFIKVSGLSQDTLLSGLRNYFSLHWNKIDFFILLTVIASCILDWILHFMSGNRSVQQFDEAMGFIRFLRLFRLLKCVYPTMRKIANAQMGSTTIRAYDIGKGFIITEEDVIKMLPILIDSKDIEEKMRTKMKSDKMMVMREFGIMQKERPLIANCAKTRQAIRTTLNTMDEAIHELRTSGWMDTLEYKSLKASLMEKRRQLQNMTKVPEVSAQILFENVPWMSPNQDVREYLYDNAIPKRVQLGHAICVPGEILQGIYLLINGLVKVRYEPDDEILKLLMEYGAVPVVDHLVNLDFNSNYEDYVVSGNTIGEMSFLTGRSVACHVITESYCEFLLIPKEALKQAIAADNDPVTGLEPRIWKTSSLPLASSILMEIMTKHSLSLNTIWGMLEKAFIPDLTLYKEYNRGEMIEEIILIQGVAVDIAENLPYVAPCHIPRHVDKLALARSSLIKGLNLPVDTKLMLIPYKDVDRYELLEHQKGICKMVETKTSKCLLHVVQYRASQLLQSKQKKHGRSSLIVNDESVR